MNYDDITKENINRYSNWLNIPDQPNKILRIGSSVTRKINVLPNLIKKQVMMIIVLLIKFVYMLRIQIKQSIAYYLSY